MVENWFVCLFFGQYILCDNLVQFFKGYQIVVLDFYESEEVNNCGLFGDVLIFFFFDFVDVFIGVVLFLVVFQIYIMGVFILVLQVLQIR